MAGYWRLLEKHKTLIEKNEAEKNETREGPLNGAS
jgi:hypothetical protein